MIRSQVMNALSLDLQEVSSSTVRMLSLVKEECQLAQKALMDADLIASQKCIDLDQQVDSIMDELEQRILTIIARRQPAAKDLRFLGAIYRALADIERAGDYAAHVAKAGADLAQNPPIKKYTDMNHIMNVLIRMIEETIHALADSSIEKAKEAHKLDREIDDLYEQIQRELLTYMLEQPKSITTSTKLLSVARNLERLGDHLENVNEHIVFWLTNERYEG